MRKVIFSLLVAGAAVAATPAAAQSWGAQHQQARAVQQQIGQLSNQIARAQQRGTISPREANGLRRQATLVQRNYQRFSRNGLNRQEVAALQGQVQQIRRNLQVERRDADRRRG